MSRASVEDAAVDPAHVLGERGLARLRVPGDGVPVDRVAGDDDAARPVRELRSVVAGQVDRLDHELPELHDSSDVQITVVEAARRVGVRQHREPARTQLGDAGDVILVGVREQRGVQLEPLRAGLGDERLQVAVAVDQNGIGTGADEVGARVPAVVARRHDRDGGEPDAASSAMGSMRPGISVVMWRW